MNAAEIKRKLKRLEKSGHAVLVGDSEDKEERHGTGWDLLFPRHGAESHGIIVYDDSKGKPSSVVVHDWSGGAVGR